MNDNAPQTDPIFWRARYAALHQRLMEARTLLLVSKSLMIEMLEEGSKWPDPNKIEEAHQEAGDAITRIGRYLEAPIPRP